MCGKCRVATTAVLHVKDQGKIEDLRFQICVLLIRAQHTEDIFRCGKFLLRIVDIKTLASHIMIIRLITIN